MSYDCIGSKWRRHRSSDIIIDGGNGGLCLRDWEKTYDCLRSFPSEHWTGGEDSYFGFHIELIGGKVGKDTDCAKLSTQHEFLYKSWGAHKISCLDEKPQSGFFNYCDDARFMLKNVDNVV